MATKTASVNFLVDPSLGSIPLINRFEKEMDSTKRQLTVTKIMLAIFATVCVATVGATIIAGLFIAPDFFLLTCFTSMIAIKVLLNISAKMKNLRTRLIEGIFSELLFLEQNGNRNITPEKLEIFKKYGHLCKELDFDSFGNECYIAEPFHNFLQWAIQETEKIKEEHSKVKTHINVKEAICKFILKIYRDIDKKFGSKLTCYRSSGRSLERKISLEIGKILSLYCTLKPPIPNPQYDPKITEQNDETRKYANKILDKEIPKSLVPKIHEILEKESFKGTSWDAKDVRKVLSYCTQIKTVKVDYNFAMKEMFEDCDSTTPSLCKVHNFKVYIIGHQTTVPCNLQTKEEGWNAEYGKQFIISRFPEFNNLN